MKRFTVLNVLLLVLIVLAGWRTAEVWQRTAPAVDAGDTLRPPGSGLPPAPRKPSTPELVNEIAQKDLFDISRRESSDDQVPQPQATPPPPPTLKLSGVIFAGLSPEAVLIDSSRGNQQIRLRVGEEISGYRVERIQSDQIALVAGTGEEVVLALRIDTSGSRKSAVGPGGKQTPRPRPTLERRPKRGADRKGGRGGKVAPKDGAGDEAEKRRADARRRAERARERLKRLRAEAARNR